MRPCRRSPPEDAEPACRRLWGGGRESRHGRGPSTEAAAEAAGRGAAAEAAAEATVRGAAGEAAERRARARDEMGYGAWDPWLETGAVPDPFCVREGAGVGGCCRHEIGPDPCLRRIGSVDARHNTIERAARQRACKLLDECLDQRRVSV